jgi:hypothetical protein
MRTSLPTVAMCSRGRLWPGVLCLIAVAGCSSSDPAAPQASGSPQRYVPSPEQAETALRAVFDAWKEGQPPGMIEGASPAVHITDTFRRADEKLVDYHILGEVPSADPRCYAIDLRFEPERFERARFTVVGIDPLWVFRLEDAQLLSHWEHNMQSPEAAAAAPADGLTNADSAAAAEAPAAPPVDADPDLREGTEP